MSRQKEQLRVSTVLSACRGCRRRYTDIPQGIVLGALYPQTTWDTPLNGGDSLILFCRTLGKVLLETYFLIAQENYIPIGVKLMTEFPVKLMREARDWRHMFLCPQMVLCISETGRAHCTEGTKLVVKCFKTKPLTNQQSMEGCSQWTNVWPFYTEFVGLVKQTETGLGHPLLICTQHHTCI